jgi:rhamnogalacturonan endolyase
MMENLGRGLVAVTTPSGVYLSWRLLGTEPTNIGFHVYRGMDRITLDPIVDSTNYLDSAGNIASSYTVCPVVDGVEQAPSPETTPLAQNYLSIPLDQGTTQRANHVGVGDLDGDGEFDFVVRRASQDVDPGASAWARSTDTFKLEAYHRTGQFLWRVDLGPNIEQGVWYSPFTVFDLDGDGRAEVITKWADSPGQDLNQDGITDYRNQDDRVDAGPEYLAVLDGATGAVRAITDWIPRGNVADWGDTYGNRVNRNLIGIAYLDGQRPSVVIFRGTYALMRAEAWNFRGGALSRVWQWMRTEGGGFHGIRVGDIDQDGRDEIINGSIAIDHDGTTLWVHGEGHGDRLHMTDIDPARPGLEIFYVEEGGYQHADHLRDARTGAFLWGPVGDQGDNGRGNCADLLPSSLGLECWSASDPNLYEATGAISPSAKPPYTNFSIWWDGDLSRELMDSIFIDKYAGSMLLSANGCSPGSRYAPMGYADIWGDWREEVIHWCGDSIRIYTTTTPTNVRQYTFMHDSDYRTSVAAETMGYMQSTQPGFYFGTGMTPAPSLPSACLALLAAPRPAAPTGSEPSTRSDPAECWPPSAECNGPPRPNEYCHRQKLLDANLSAKPWSSHARPARCCSCYGSDFFALLRIRLSRPPDLLVGMRERRDYSQTTSGCRPSGFELVGGGQRSPSVAQPDHVGRNRGVRRRALLAPPGCTGVSLVSAQRPCCADSQRARVSFCHGADSLGDEVV